MVRLLIIILLVYLALRALAWIIRELILPPPPRKSRQEFDDRKEGEIRIEKAPEDDRVEYAEYKEVK